MRQHRINLAGVRCQVALRQRLVAVVAGDVGEQFFEVGDVAVDGGAEFRLSVIFALDIVKGLLALQRIEATGEDVALAALIAAPERCRPTAS